MSKNTPKKIEQKQQTLNREELSVRNEMLRKKLTASADALASNKYTDPALDKANQKKVLTDLRLSKPLLRILLTEPKPYSVHFPLEFYRQIYRLWKLPTDGRKLYDRPGFIGGLTNQIIYLRFPAEVLVTLKKKNQLFPDGSRRYKHFQFLTELADDKLKEFIDDAIRIMKKSNSWTEFKNLFSHECGRSYQYGLFD